MRRLPYSFALSPDAVTYLGGLEPVQALDRVSNIRRLWKKTGVLVVDSRSDLRKVYEGQWKARGFPQGTRKKLEDLFLEMRSRIARDTGWEFSDDAPVPPVRPSGGTLFVHPASAEDWGLPSGLAASVLAEDVEVCRADCLNVSRWNELEEAVVIQKKAPTKDIVGGLAAMKAVARIATVIDPYCAKEQAVTQGASGLLRFLEMLAEAPCTLERRLDSVVVYSSKNVPRSQQDSSIVSAVEIHAAWSAASPRLASAGIRSVSLRLVDGRRFGAIAHDRFISFRDLQTGRWGGLTLQLGGGFSVFEGKGLSKETTVSIVSNDSFDEIVRSLEAEPSFEAFDLEAGKAGTKG